MKKLLLVAFTLLLLVGCTEKGYSELSDGSEVLFKGPDGNYTKNDLYRSLKLNSEEAIENDLLKRIATNLDIDLTAIETEAEEMLELYKQMGYESAIISYYGGDEGFKQMYASEGILSELCKVYINDNFDELVAEDKPVQMQMVYFTEEETANAMIEEINAGATFDSAAINQGYTSSAEPVVYLDSSDLPVEVKSYLNDTNSLGLSSIITVNNTSTDADGNPITVSTYYLLNVNSKDVNDFKDDYISEKLVSIDQSVVKTYMFENHDIEFFDQDIYEMMKAQYEVLQ